MRKYLPFVLSTVVGFVLFGTLGSGCSCNTNSNPLEPEVAAPGAPTPTVVTTAIVTPTVLPTQVIYGFGVGFGCWQSVSCGSSLGIKAEVTYCDQNNLSTADEFIVKNVDWCSTCNHFSTVYFQFMPTYSHDTSIYSTGTLELDIRILSTYVKGTSIRFKNAPGAGSSVDIPISTILAAQGGAGFYHVSIPLSSLGPLSNFGMLYVTWSTLNSGTSPLISLKNIHWKL